MSEIKFSELNLLPEMQRAIDELGFENATDIQAQAIPTIREGRDLIGKSQTGTGKTLAFAIPTLEKLDLTEAQPTVQAIILCPTRELAMQGCDEIKKLTRFMRNVWVTDVYGGAPMDRQIAQLKRCNIVIGTPGRVMDHMRRGTLSLANVKLVCLDEADEMLSMGFREDIETILKDVPEEHQTLLFSATMPDAIMELTETYQNEPYLIEINAEQVTLENIRQTYIEVPMGRKLDALNLILRAYEPRLCMIFCNTKLMVEEVTQYLSRSGFSAEALHGDLNQSQRTRVMDAFKAARVPILIATDVAARGIDVNDIDYVINYDIPNHDEYYVHRIGRTGRAGKEGCAINICSGRRQLQQLKLLSMIARSEITEQPIPKVADIRAKQLSKRREAVAALIEKGVANDYLRLITEMIEEGAEPTQIAAAAMQYAFSTEDVSLQDITMDRRSGGDNSAFRRLTLSLGRHQGIAPNHVVSAVCERSGLKGRDIGKIEIYDNRTIVGIPAGKIEMVARKLRGLTVCGFPADVRILDERPTRSDNRAEQAMPDRDRGNRKTSAAPKADTARSAASGGKVRLSESARARLLDGDALDRFEINKSARRKDTHGKYSSPDFKKSGKRDSREHHKNNDRGSIRRGKHK